MPTTHPTLKYVQQAGQAVSTAREELNTQLQRQVDKLASVVAAQPFSPDTDRAYAQLRAVARMAQELQSIEDQLLQMYRAAAQFEEEHDIKVLVALPPLGSKAKTASTDEVVDVKEVHPGHHALRPRVARRSRQTKKAVQRQKSQDSRVTNEARLLEGLYIRLNKRSWTAMTQAQMAQFSGIPQGSIGAALNRVIASGQVLVGERGKYRLA